MRMFPFAFAQIVPKSNAPAAAGMLIWFEALIQQ